MRFLIINMRVIIKYIYIYYFMNHLKFTSRHYLFRFRSSYYRSLYFHLTYFDNLNISLLKTLNIIIIFFF